MNKRQEKTHEEILEIIRSYKNNSSSFPDDFASKVNSILTEDQPCLDERALNTISNRQYDPCDKCKRHGHLCKTCLYNITVCELSNELEELKDAIRTILKAIE